MRVLVAGGAGYIGSHCVRDLCQAGHDVVVLDHLRSGHREAVDSHAKLIAGDVTDSDLLASLFAGESFDGVMHFAAYLDVNESVRDPIKYYRNNIAGTACLLDAMAKHDVKRFVFSSTCATYGIPPEMPIREDTPQNPINPYGRTKLTAEWMLRDCAEAWGLGACALRYFNAAGAAEDGLIGEDHDPEFHLIPLVLQVALGQRERIMIFGTDYATPDGTCVRDYIHVDDLAVVHRLALESQESGTFRAFNVGTGVGTSVREVIEAAREVTGHPIPADEAPRREGDPPQLYADPGKARAEIGFQARFTNITDIVASAWKWHRTHPDGYHTKV